MKFSSTFNTSVQRCLYPVFQNQCPHFLLLHIFRRMAVHPSPSEFTSRTHPLIFLWIPKGLISPEYFLIFFSNLRIPPIFQPWKGCFKLMVLRLLEIHSWVKDLNLFIFTHIPKQNSPPSFYHYYSRQREITHFSQAKSFENLFFPSREGEEYGAENITKIKFARILVTSFDIFHHLQP